MAMASILDSYNKVLTPINAKSTGRSGSVDSAMIYSDLSGKSHQDSVQAEEQKKLEEALYQATQLQLQDLTKQIATSAAQPVAQYVAPPAAAQSYAAVVAPPAPAAAPAPAPAPAPAAAVDPRVAAYTNWAASYQRPAMLGLSSWNTANSFPANQPFGIPKMGAEAGQGSFSPYQMYVNEYNNAAKYGMPAPNAKNNFSAPVEQQYPITFGGRRPPTAAK